MKYWNGWGSSFAMLGLFVSASLVADPAVYRGLFKGSSMRVDGTSTVHDWTVESKLISGSFELEGDFPADLSVTTVPELAGAPKAEIKIAARSLKSGKATMDAVMMGAMKADDHPWILYTLKALKPSEAEREAGQPLAYEATGELNVAGVAKPLKMPVSIAPTEDGLKITGKAQVKMTDFGIDPPAPKIALGLIKTGDEVDLTFEWLTKKR